MKRLGMFSGKIYDENEVSGMNECGECLTESQAEDSEYINKMKAENLAKCGGCHGCPMAEVML